MEEVRMKNMEDVMKHAAYILGSIEFFLGIILLWFSSIMKNAMPVLGRIAYQAAAAGSYSSSNYDVAVAFPTVLSVLLIIVGIAQIAYAFLKK